MSDYIAQCTTWVPGFVPSAVLVPPGYMLVGSNAPLPPVTYHVPAPASTTAGPTIHPALARPPFQWDVRATAFPPTLMRDHPFLDEPAFSPHTASITLRFTTSQGVTFTHTISGAGRALRVVDVLRAIHDALYTPAARPPDGADGVLRAAGVAEGYRSLRRDEGLYRVDLYPISPNRVGGARLYFAGLEWGGGRGHGEVRVSLGPGA